jgi:hypothetical protein
LHARDWIATDTDAGGLAETRIRGLLDRFIGQGAGAGDDAPLARQVDVTRHDADLALAGVMIPGQFGPIIHTPVSSSLHLTCSMSRVGMPSVGCNNELDARSDRLEEWHPCRQGAGT